LGFTLMEFAVAMVISTLLMVGAAYILRYMVVQTGANGDRTMAQLQAQYVSFWIGQDVVQAGNVTLGSSTGFPLTLTWTGLDGGNSTVIYDVVPNPNLSGNTSQLTRTEVDVEGIGNVTSMVAQYVVPWDPVKQQGTRACQGGNATNPDNVLVLQVAAQVDRSAASSSYELSPRYGNETLVWGYGNSTTPWTTDLPAECYCPTTEGAWGGQ